MIYGSNNLAARALDRLGRTLHQGLPERVVNSDKVPGIQTQIFDDACLRIRKRIRVPRVADGIWRALLICQTRRSRACDDEHTILILCYLRYCESDPGVDGVCYHIYAFIVVPFS